MKMNPRLLAGLSGFLACMAVSFAADPPADSAAQARQKLAGVWKGFVVEGKGEKPDRGPVKLKLTITDKSMHGIETKGAGEIDHGEGEYTFDLASDPRGLDAAKTNDRDRKDGWQGIYQLDGDTLRWCVAKKARPTAFETVKGQFLMILKREKLTP